MNSTSNLSRKFSREFSRDLDKVVKRLVQGLRPTKIYLYGSYAKGTAIDSSDIDLLVVLESSNLPRHKREAQSYNLLWGLSTPVEVIVLTEKEFSNSLSVKTSLPASIIKHGKLLYASS
jgi:uncharacterized protein